MNRISFLNRGYAFKGLLAVIKDKQINHDNHHDKSKTRTHRFSKLSDDGDPWVPNNSQG